MHDICCPECGKKQHDLWDHDWVHNEEVIATCGECGAEFHLLRRVVVEFEAKPIEE
jgi:hypothetical protein